MTWLRLGLAAWGARRGLARALVVAVAAVFALPAMLALAIVAASAGGPAPEAPAGARGPLPTWTVSQPYGCTGLGLEPARGACPHFHFGIDLVAPPLSAVFAVLPGRVEVLPPAGYGGGYGLHVVLHHAGGLDTMYAHLADTAVTDGDAVAAGAVLGHEGSSGLSTGPHLHFEVREAGVAVDPISVFPGIFGPEGQPR